MNAERKKKCLIVALSMDFPLWKWTTKEKKIQEKCVCVCVLVERKMQGKKLCRVNKVQHSQDSMNQTRWLEGNKTSHMNHIKSFEVNCPHCPLSALTFYLCLFPLFLSFSVRFMQKEYVVVWRIFIEPRSVCHWYDNSLRTVHLFESQTTRFCQSRVFYAPNTNKRRDFSSICSISSRSTRTDMQIKMHNHVVQRFIYLQLATQSTHKSVCNTKRMPFSHKAELAVQHMKKKTHTHKHTRFHNIRTFEFHNITNTKIPNATHNNNWYHLLCSCWSFIHFTCTQKCDWLLILFDSLAVLIAPYGKEQRSKFRV